MGILQFIFFVYVVWVFITVFGNYEVVRYGSFGIKSFLIYPAFGFMIAVNKLRMGEKKDHLLMFYIVTIILVLLFALLSLLA